MKTIIAAFALTVAASTGAFAQSTALDVSPIQAGNGTAPIATGATGTDYAVRGRLGDGSPVFLQRDASGIDFTATASIGDAPSVLENHDNRLLWGNN